MSALRVFIRAVLICTVASGVFFSVAAHAQVIVLQSTVKKYKPGVTITNSANINVPDGQMILVMLPSGVTRKINGPFNGSAGRLAKSGGRSNAALFKAVASYVKTGGATASTIGATRSARATGARLNIPFSWNTIHVRASGYICIDKNSPVTVARSAAKSPKLFSLIDLSATQRAQLVFPAGMNELPWPVELKLQSGNYGVITKGRKVYQVRIRLLDQLPAPENTLQVLHSQRCTMQLKSYLRELATQQATQATQ